MKNLLEQLLRFFAAAILKKYRPKVIGITGSVGKTSTKEAIFTVLSPHFKVRKSEKSYNNEIGVPLTVIGGSAQGKSVFGWLAVFLKAVFLLCFKSKNYPDILVLEMAADKPGDIRYFLKFIKCDIGVVTAIAPVHLEQFKEIDKIIKEKSKIVSELGADDLAILNYDDENVRNMRGSTKAKVLTFGFEEGADFRCMEFIPGSVSYEEDKMKTPGVSFKILSDGKAVPMRVQNVLGKQQIYAVLAAVAVGAACDLNLIEIAEALPKYKAPAGRMKVLAGIKNTIIIDDSYNASPRSTLAALDVLAFLPKAEDKFKYAVLGDMRELGAATESSHREVGKAIKEKSIDYLIAVGPDAHFIADEAEKQGMSIDNIFAFDNPEDAGRFLQERIRQGDIILVKGSRAMKMEKAILEIMAEPDKAEKLLVN